MNGQLLDTEEAAARLKLSASYLEKLRVRGGGPTFATLGRKVRYRVCDLDAWAEARLASSTSERAAA
jgi:excisionase family DNA binding protein